MKNEVSVIIVNWNGKKWFKKCLDSLESQTYKQFEIIVIDNGSSDGSVQYLRKYYPGVKIIENNKNLGFGNAVNIGISNSHGEYILLLNNDAWVDNDFLDKILKFYKRNNFDVIGPYEAKYDKHAHNYTSTKIDILGHPVYLKSDKYTNEDSFYLSGVCIFYKKKMYIDTQGLDNNFFMYFEEIDWFWRMLLLKKRVAYVPNLYIYHYGSASTGGYYFIKEITFLWRNENTLQMLLKNYSWYNLLWVLPLYFIQNIFEIIFFLGLLKPRIALTYIKGWWFNIKNFRRTWSSRSWVQKNRKVGDIEIMKKMYIGFGKLYHLIEFYEKKKSL